MPEGHTIHRLARLQRRSLGTGPIRVSSPQGRFAAGAARLDGQRLEGIDAVGKHLLYRWNGGEVLHIHLGLFGKYRTHPDNPPPPTPNTRLVLDGEATVYLSGPTVCELIDPIFVDDLRSRLGPDPLDRGADPERMAAALARRTVPIGAALLDQRAIAGLGNIYRAELLFLGGIHPNRPANALDGDEPRELWRRAVDLLRIGERLGRIVTVDHEEIGARSPGTIPRGERLYVYKRKGKPCRRCGTEIERWELGGRNIWACPTCQPER